MRSAGIFVLVLLGFFACALAVNPMGPRKCMAAADAQMCVAYEDAPVKLGGQCGLCQSLTEGNKNYFCADKGTYCGLATKNAAFTTCLPVLRAGRGEACFEGTHCDDARYPLSCLKQGVNHVCGSAGVYSAGFKCAASPANDLLVLPGRAVHGCINGNCVMGQCNTSIHDCRHFATPEPGSLFAPAPPGAFCDEKNNARPFLNAGDDCTEYPMGCNVDAECVPSFSWVERPVRSICVKHGSATVGQSCLLGGMVCSGELACVANADGHPTCTALVRQAEQCTVGKAGECDALTGTTSCECNFKTGTASCVGTNAGAALTAAFAAYTACAAQHGCSTQTTPYYKSCADYSCANEWAAYACAAKTAATATTTLLQDNTGLHSACDLPSAEYVASGAAPAALLVSAAAVVVAVALIL